MGQASLQLWVFCFVAFFGAETTLDIPELRVFAQVLFATPVLVVALLAVLRDSDHLDHAVGVLLVAYGVVCLTSSNVPASLETLGLAATFAALFIAMRRATNQQRGALAVGVSIALAFSLSVQAGLWVREKGAWISAGGGVPRLESFDVFVWASANAIPVLALLAIAAVAWIPRGKGRTALIVVLVAASVITVPLSVGRSGWLGLAVTAALLLSSRMPARLLRYAPHLGLAIGATGLLAAIALLIKSPETVFRLLQGRDVVWREAAELYARSPLWGTGPGTFSWQRLTAGQAFDERLSVRLAHDVPLQTFVDGGLLLALALAAIIIAWAISVARSPEWASQRTRLTCAVLAGFGVAVLFDDQSYLPAITACVVTFAAWVVPFRSGPRLSSTGRLSRAALPLAMFVALALALPNVVAADAGRLSADVGRNAALRGDWQDAAGAFRQAVDWRPDHPAYHLSLGMALAMLDNPGATSEYLAAVRLSPGDPRGYGALAQLDTDHQLAWLEMAATRTIRDPQYLYRYGRALLDAGRGDAALDALARATLYDPDLYAVVARSVGGRALLDQELTSLLDAEEPVTFDLDALRQNMLLADGGRSEDLAPAWSAVAAAGDGRAAGSRLDLDRARHEQPFDAHTYLAGLAASALTCQSLGSARDVRLLDLLVGAGLQPPPIRQEWDQTYRERGLGDYQPRDERPPSGARLWPFILLGKSPSCPGKQ